jgi:NTP pyrophosphatase (non-canonical NTP hydrolase)
VGNIQESTEGNGKGILLKFNEYIQSVKRTESPNFNSVNSRILHGVIGCCTEAGELLDSVKKSLFYGRELDYINIEEEIGDLFWYVALIMDECQFDLEHVLERNIAKLKIRYPEQFTNAHAENRNLEAERSELER